MLSKQPSWPQWLCGLRHRSAATWLLELLTGLNPTEGMDVHPLFVVCFVKGGPCNNWSIIQGVLPGVCLDVCDLEARIRRRPRHNLGCCATGCWGVGSNWSVVKWSLALGRPFYIDLPYFLGIWPILWFSSIYIQIRSLLLHTFGLNGCWILMCLWKLELKLQLVCNSVLESLYWEFDIHNGWATII
jgi:hypothetical protein